MKLIPLIKRSDLGAYICFSDAILGQMKTGMQGAIERDSAFCKKLVLSYTDPLKPSIIDGEEIIPPFEPKSNDPKIIAELIDRVVECKKYREELIEKQSNYIMKLSQPQYAIKIWEKSLEEMIPLLKGKKRERIGIKIFFEYLFFRIIEKRVIKKYAEKNIESWGKEIYQKLMKN